MNNDTDLARIINLNFEALCAGDDEMAAICAAALHEGDEDAWEEALAICEATARAE